MVKFRRRKPVNEAYGMMPGGVDDNQLSYNPYRYSIINLNTSLSQKGNSINTDRYVNIGSYIEGEGYNGGDLHTGIIRNIIRNEDGTMNHIIILDSKTTRMVKIKINNKIKLLR
jgi:hypothetical protein